MPTAGGCGAWYARMFEYRTFTSGELRVADAAKVVSLPDLLHTRRRPTGSPSVSTVGGGRGRYRGPRVGAYAFCAAGSGLIFMGRAFC